MSYFIQKKPLSLFNDTNFLTKSINLLIQKNML